MDAPERITREKLEGRDCSVAWMADGRIKVLFDDGEVRWAVAEPPGSPAEPPGGRGEGPGKGEGSP